MCSLIPTYEELFREIYNKMNMAYIAMNRFKNEANTIQLINMLNSFTNTVDLTFITSWHSNKQRNILLKSMNISTIGKIVRFPIFISFFPIEMITRLIFAIFTFFHLSFNKYDVIYTRDFSVLLFLSIFFPKLKFVFENHKILYKTSKKVPFFLESFAYKKCDGIVVISKGIKDDLTSFFSYPSKNILVSPDGVNNAFLESVYQPKNNTIVYSGSCKSWKGVSTLVNSLKYIKTPVTLHLAGINNKDLKKLSNKIPSNIVCYGYISQKNVIKLLSKSAIAILPNSKVLISEKYTSPLKLFEYLGIGLPIIASDLTSFREILSEENAFFFKPNSARDLAYKIDSLIGDKIKMKYFSKNNKLLSKLYTWDKRAESIVSFLSQLNI